MTLVFKIMEEGQKRSHKPGLGTSDNATKRHVVSSREKTKRNREKKLLLKRKPIAHANDGSNLSMLIGRLSPHLNSLQDLRDLDQVLRQGLAAEPFFAPCPHLYASASPPWIFPEGTDKLKELDAILQSTQDVTTLRVATNCLVNITSHEDSEWTLFCIPMLPTCFQLLQTCRDATVQEHLYWAMANMCWVESARDLIIANNQVMQPSVGPEDWKCLQVLSYFFKALFIRHPLPKIERIASLWHLLIARLSEAPENFVQDMYDAVMLMLKGRRDDYKLAIIQDVTFWSHLSSLPNIQCIRILSSLSFSRQTTEELVERGTISLYVQLLNHRNPEARAEGGLGLSNLAETGKVTMQLMNNDILDAIQRQLRCTDVYRVRKQIYWFMCSLSRHVPPNLLAELVVRGYIERLVDILRLPGENTLKSRAMQALLRFSQVDKYNTLAKMEEADANYTLNNLSTDPDLEISALAGKLLDLAQEEPEERLDLTTSQMNFTF